MSTQIEWAALDLSVGPAHRPHPQADPERTAVAAAHLQLQPGDFLASQTRADGLLCPCPSGRRLGEEFEYGRTLQFLRGVAEQLRCAAVDTDQPPVSAERYVCIGRLFVKVSIALLALHKSLLDPQPLKLDGGAGGEDLEDEQTPRLGWHGPLVEHRQVAEYILIAVEQRHA